MNSVNKAPLHLWVIGILSLIWNAYGGFDYLMTQTHNTAYLAAFTPEQRAWVQSFPAWAVAAWAIGVWGAVAGSVLLLLRNGLAVTAFAASLVGLLVSTVWQFMLADIKATAFARSSDYYIMAAIWVIAIALLVYAVRIRARGVLR